MHDYRLYIRKENNMNYIDKTARLGENCQIGNFTTIGTNCKIGNRVIIHNNVTLYPGTEIGDDTEIFDNVVIGREPKSTGNLVHKLESNFEPVKIGNNCCIGAGVVIYASCKIGNNVLIGDNASLREHNILKDKCLLARGSTTNHHVTIGQNSKVMDLTHLTARTIIEDNVFVGANVTTVNDNAMRLKGNEVGSSVSMHFCKGCRVGSSATILPGICIGKNALVAAGSIVTKDVRDGATVMGVSAKERV